MATIYSVNRNINKPIAFKGLKAQYIWILGGAAVGLLILYAIMYVCGINAYICVPVILGAGTFAVKRIYGMSNKYGQYGLMKKSARKGVPKALISRSRKVFTNLYSSYAGRPNR